MFKHEEMGLDKLSPQNPIWIEAKTDNEKRKVRTYVYNHIFYHKRLRVKSRTEGDGLRFWVPD